MKALFYFLLLAFLISCEGPTPRHPVKRNTTNSIQAAIARSKSLLAAEERLMQAIIARDSTQSYSQSASGSWYFYNKKNNRSNATAQPDDIVTMTYNVLGFNNDTIYSMQDIGLIKYKVDKQELFPGLRHAVKMLKENETATFLFPSSLGYGVPGDGNLIGVNMPIKSTVAIVKIEKDSL